MANPNKKAYNLIEGQAALIVIDIQAGAFSDQSAVREIDHMDNYAERMLLARTAIDKPRECNIPVIFIHMMRLSEQWSICRAVP